MVIGSGLRTDAYTVQIGNLPASFVGLKIVFLTDLHGNEYGPSNRILLDRIMKQKPELILIGGDLITNGRENPAEERRTEKVAEAFVRELRQMAPVIYAYGNHEGRMREEPKERFRERMTSAGAEVLDNESIRLVREVSSEDGGSRTEELRICGLDLPKRYFPKFRRTRLSAEVIESMLPAEVGGDGRQRPATILLAHHPFYFDAYADWGADLVLSGHLHGGIMRLPIIEKIWPRIGGAIGPDFIPFPPYSGGLFRKEMDGKTSTMIVSRGLGEHTIPLRIFNPPEISVITLKKG